MLDLEFCIHDTEAKLSPTAIPAGKQTNTICVCFEFTRRRSLLFVTFLNLSKQKPLLSVSLFNLSEENYYMFHF